MKTKMLALLLLAVGLAGCAPQVHMSDLQASCEQRYPYFPDMVPCLRSEVAAYTAGHRNDSPDLDNVYLAWLDAAGEGVRNGQMSETEARLGAAQLYSRIRQESLNRDYAAKADYSRRYADFLAGVAVFNATMQQQQQPSSPVVTCVSGIVITCY